jgi:syntaxin 5
MGDGSPGRKFEKGKIRAHQNGDVLALDLGSAEEGTSAQNGGAFMQMQLVEQQVLSFLVLRNNLLNNARRTLTFNPAHRLLNPSNRQLQS